MKKYITKKGQAKVCVGLYIDEALYIEAKDYITNFSAFFTAGLEKYLQKCQKTPFQDKMGVTSHNRHSVNDSQTISMIDMVQQEFGNRYSRKELQHIMMTFDNLSDDLIKPPENDIYDFETLYKNCPRSHLKLLAKAISDNFDELIKNPDLSPDLYQTTK